MESHVLRQARFPAQSIRRLFGEVFPDTHVQIETYGNVFTAVCNLHGLGAGEVTREELAYCDLNYEIIISVRAQRPL